MTRVLKAAPGVKDVQVTLEPAQAKVQYDAALTNAERIKAVVEDAGYDVG